jgi:hypothetical protein
MDLSSYKPLWLGLAEMSGITVEGVTYDHSKRIAYQNETRRKAVLAAKEKAADLAAALGSEIAEPVRIEEDLTINDACRAASSLSNSNRVDGGSGGAEQESLAPRNDSYPHPGEAHVSPRNARRVRIWLETTARFKATGWIPSGGSGSISLNALWFATWRGREQRQRWETGHPPNADQRRWAQFLRAFQRLEYRDRIEVHRFPFARARIIT